MGYPRGIGWFIFYLTGKNMPAMVLIKFLNPIFSDHGPLKWEKEYDKIITVCKN